MRPHNFTETTRNVVQAFDDVFGQHPGFRPTHAKGILLDGSFTPSAEAVSLTRAPHIANPATPVTVRFSNFGGIPAIPDTDPEAAPRGIAIRFHLGEHIHTDIVAHSINGFPTRTAEQFVDFLRAIHASGPGVPHPTPIEAFLAANPPALAFAMAPKPVPSSFARERYFAVNAYRFIDSAGEVRLGRYIIEPQAGTDYLTDAAVRSMDSDFLSNEIRALLSIGSARMNVLVQLADPGDVTDDSTIQWPDTRRKVLLGTVALNAVAPNNMEAR